MNSQYKELSDKAYSLHCSNHLDDAEKIYIELLNENPNDVNILNLLGLLYLSKQKFDIAITYLTRALVLKKDVYVAANLGKAYFMNNQAEYAVRIYNSALEIEENDDLYYSLAIAYKKLKDYENAIKSYKNALRINPEKYNALYNLANLYNELEDTDNAVLYAEKALAINGNDENLYVLLSGCYENKNDYDNAVYMLQKAVLLNPKNNLYFYNLGVLFSKLNQDDNAINAYLRSIQLNSRHIESYVNISAIYRNSDKNIALEYLEKAYNINPEAQNVLLGLAQIYKDFCENKKSISYLEKIIINNKNNAEAYSLLGANYMDIADYEKALDCYNKAAAISPKNNNYLHGKAIALKYLGSVGECKSILENIVRNDKNQTQSSIALGMIYLSEGDFYNGMRLYRMRSYESKLKTVFKDKIWDENIDITGKNILVYSDCGLGDTIMFARYLPELSKKVNNITLQTDKELVKILKDSFPEINIISKGIMPPDYDFVIPMMDLSLALKKDFSDIPFKDSYLKVEDDKRFDNLEILKTQKKRIGLFWQGNKHILKNRSISFELISRFFENKNINFYSFQIDVEAKESENFYNLKKYIKDYSDTALLLNKMDLLITVDSSIVHMAGAIGKRTYLILPCTAEWRWFKDEKNTLWYNSVELFRQKNSNDAGGVIDRIKDKI